jgi:hypothetical protein
MSSALIPESTTMSIEEIVIDLHTPDDGPLPTKVRVLGKSRFLCMRSTDFFANYRVLAGDTFEADLLADRLYLFRSVVQPSAMLHFQADLGLFMQNEAPRGNRTQEEKDKASRSLGNIIHSQYSTQALLDFMKECNGALELDEFFFCFTLTLHVPPVHREALMAEVPNLCPGLKSSQLNEIFSGATEW